MRSNITHKNTKIKLEQKKSRSGNRVKLATGKSYMNRENAQQMISCEQWYYTQASYKDDHEL